ncbi:hypothetical protein [Liquorilactobacillus satsumensis]|uniref:Uncharacterized protein n=1 Tax=Liquorilactobacillus satsumensis DSM 16230 = JCM 12392 TaxID=1423801 RepID=A0A0R1V4L8_9LACO|nr:hypothetical protein [Liquorilactobacillus satsumensis]KRL98050.1 hypothetical protein FD50_GL001009 [Liquorilactobacillus satsumensis DSM 16230 = JCM 12392]
MSKDERQATETFEPQESTTESTAANAATLSTSGRLMAYNDQLKDSLKHGQVFTELLDTLIETTSATELLTAAQRLVAYQLDTSFVTFPQQYSQSDFYLIFLNRLLALHGRERVILQSSDRFHELYHEFLGINTHGYFVFQLEETAQRGAYYTEKNTGETLFYLNFEKQVLRFNSRALTQLLLVDYEGKVAETALRGFENYLLDIGKFLKEDFGFDTDFTLMDPSNSAVYQLADPNLSSTVLDKLFVETAKGGRILERGAEGEAVLKLDDHVVVRLFSQETRENETDGWVLKVSDPEHKESWFDILLKYSFLRAWYLDNLASLEIRADSLYFN